MPLVVQPTVEAEAQVLTPLAIELPVDTPCFKIRTTLDGLEYVLRFDYSETEDRWYMSISDLEEIPIRRGIKVVPAYDLLATARSVANCPPALLAFFAPGLTAIGFSDLGRRAHLIYIPGSNV